MTPRYVIPEECDSWRFEGRETFSSSRHLPKRGLPERLTTAELINLVLDDQLPAGEVKDALNANAKRREELEPRLKVADEPPPLLHPSMANLYRSKLEELASALQREDTRVEASEMLRGLIDSIVLTPEKGQLRIELRGNLAAMLTAAQQTKRSSETGDLLVPVQLVAGARNRRYLQLWSVAA